MAHPLAILKKYWGYSSFRPLQEDIIMSVLEGKDTLALMPTGGGKSICFQVPALCKEGICIVVSPLIALMKDQVHNLKKIGIQAEAVYSGMHYKEIDRLFDNCIHGNTKLLYLSPERLSSEMAKERIRQMNVNLLAVDEAHCISQWGYDFRPPYLKIAEIREVMPTVPVLALTATATKQVVTDIQNKLNFKEEHVLSKSFHRNNLAYVVFQEDNKQKKLLDIIKNVKGSGVVYVRNRKKTKSVAQFLNNNNISAAFYHAGLSPEQRTQRQQEWIEGKQRIMVSTNAFGMGIDKSNVRTVVHLDLPDSLEAYFQEAGRGGRDGKKAFAVLLYHTQDKNNLERNYEMSFPPMSEIRQVYRALGSYFQLATGSGQGRAFDFDIVEFCNNFKLEVLKTYSCLKILEQEGWLILTEAIHIPSTFKVLISREQLYDFQLKNPSLNLIIKTLLRVTEGAFQNFVKINETAIARFLKMPQEKLLLGIKQLHKERVLEYRPAKNKPQLIFSNERAEAENLTIDIKSYNLRKSRYKDRIQKAIEYATSPICRSQQLLYYFGENAEPCGICDVCLARKKDELSGSDYERYKSKIKTLLIKEHLTEQQLLASFSSNRHQRVIHALAFLMDEGVVSKKEGKLTWIG